MGTLSWGHFHVEHLDGNTSMGTFSADALAALSTTVYNYLSPIWANSICLSAYRPICLSTLVGRKTNFS